ncbi:hypothetical protein BG015_005679, partial [Linnemannia schmuckeri]
MERFVNERFNEDNDPEITSQPALQYYRPKEYDIALCLSIKPDKPIEYSPSKSPTIPSSRKPLENVFKP